MEVDFNPKIEKRLKSKWNSKYNSLKKFKSSTLDSADQFVAGQLILKGMRRLLNKIRTKQRKRSTIKQGKSILPEM